MKMVSKQYSDVIKRTTLDVQTESQHTGKSGVVFPEMFSQANVVIVALNFPKPLYILIDHDLISSLLISTPTI